MASYKLGMLDQRVNLERASRTADGVGGYTINWQLIAQLWAHVSPNSGSEREEAQRVEQQVKYLVVLREPVDVRPGDTIVWNTHRLNVEAVKVTPRSPWLELDCALGAAS